MTAVQGIRLPDTPEPMYRWPGSGGLTLAADSWGESSGPLVVLLHGGGQTRHAWKGTGERLAEAGYYVIAYDARGHGDSDWAPDGDYTSDALAEDLACIVEAAGGKRPALVGASMGGSTSLVAVGERHLTASCIVLVDIAPHIDRSGAARIRAFMRQKPEGFTSLEEVADAIASYQPHRSRPSSLSGLAKNVRIAPSGKYIWHWDPKVSTSHSDLDEFERRLRRSAQNITVPCLVVRGASSDVLSEDGVRQFLDLVPGSESLNVEGAAHMVAGDQNDPFASAVINFLSKWIPAAH